MSMMYVSFYPRNGNKFVREFQEQRVADFIMKADVLDLPEREERFHVEKRELTFKQNGELHLHLFGMNLARFK